MTLLYMDTSALARAYLPDEPGHRELRALILEGEERLVTSDLSRFELASALVAAGRAGRLPSWRRVLGRVDIQLQGTGRFPALPLRPEVVFEPAHRIVLDHGLRTLDALHLAVAAEECPALDDDVVFVTRDELQARAARALGLAVA